MLAGKIVFKGGAPVSSSSGSIGPAPNSPTNLDITNGTGQFTVTWLAPLLNADGSSISSPGLLNYIVYWGATPFEQHNGGSYTGSATVAAGTVTKTVTSLAAGTWYVAVSAVSAYGEGASSNESIATVS